jgi:hypothetical protein
MPPTRETAATPMANRSNHGDEGHGPRPLEIALILYSRPGCHLCEEMKAVVSRVGRTLPLTLEEVDVGRDAVLEARYGLEIPVLLLAGRPVAKHRVTEAALLRILRARLEGA